MGITELLAFSVKHNASDLHLSAGVSPMIRIDGEVRKLDKPSLSDSEVHDVLLEVMSEAQQKEFAQKLEVDFCYDIASIGRFRVNAFHQKRGCAIVFRSIPVDIPTLEALGCPSIFSQISIRDSGLILVTGPTGSGKSTTVAAMVNFINQHLNKHILTIEDPIEFVHSNIKCLINQREVHSDTHGFKVALRSALREDPDVILVGELRDQETISLALTAAETGHLVFATLHTSSAAKTIDRVIDVFPGNDKSMVRSMLSESLTTVIAQKLLKKKSGGRVACYEIMMATPAIRNLIRDNKVAQMYSIIQTGSASGMITMQQSANKLLKNGVVVAQEVSKKIGSDAIAFI